MVKRNWLTITFLLLAAAGSTALADSSHSPEEIAALRARVAAGELDAMQELGATRQGDKDPSNDIEGRDLVIRAAEGGQWGSAAYLGRAYLYGWYDWARADGKANFAEGLMWLRRAGDLAPPDAAAQDVYQLLGQIYSGYAVRDVIWPERSIDEAEAITWYRRCALELVPFCEWQLGHLLIKSSATAAEGVEWLLNAANAGHEYSMTELARLYESGTVLKKDLAKAIIWYERSAKWGITVSGRTLFEQVSRKKVAELSKQLTPEEVASAMELAEQFKPSTRGRH